MNQKQKKVVRLFIVSVAAALLLALSIALVHPAQWLANNRNTRWLSNVAGVMFWISLISLPIFQILGRSAAKQASYGPPSRSKREAEKKKWYQKLFATKEAMVFAAIFVIGIVLAAVFLCQTRFSTIQTFLAAGAAILGLTNYINFNSKSYRLIRTTCERKKKSSKER